MIVDVEAKAVCQIDIDAGEAFRVLCKTLHMDFVLDEDTDFSVEMDYETGESVVYATKDGNKELYDDRGNLFIALRNVAVNMFPNTAFRGADYIYN